MDTNSLRPGSRIEHARHGSGSVTYVGTDYVGIAFDNAGEVLIRRETLVNDAPATNVPVEPRRDALPWPESTFVPGGDDARHSPGSHWNAFMDDSTEIIEYLPGIVHKALPQTGYGEERKPSRTTPADWPVGFQLVWPLRAQSMALTLRPENEAKTLVGLFPIFANGSQHTLILREVSVFNNGLEAQITAHWGESEVTFYDTQYVINRTWYETGKNYDFVFTGLAYFAGPAEIHELKVERHPDEVAWMNQRLRVGEVPYEAAFTMKLDGMAIFLPISDGDVDDYSFHAPVKSVSEFTNWLGQDGWRVRATVMRFGDEDADLDILITRRAWSGDTPPQVGQDIDGRLWLQGYLWKPK